MVDGRLLSCTATTLNAVEGLTVSNGYFENREDITTAIFRDVIEKSQEEKLKYVEQREGTEGVQQTCHL